VISLSGVAEWGRAMGALAPAQGASLEANQNTLFRYLKNAF